MLCAKNCRGSCNARWRPHRTPRVCAAARHSAQRANLSPSAPTRHKWRQIRTTVSRTPILDAKRLPTSTAASQLLHSDLPPISGMDNPFEFSDLMPCYGIARRECPSSTRSVPTEFNACRSSDSEPKSIRQVALHPFEYCAALYSFGVDSTTRTSAWR